MYCESLIRESYKIIFGRKLPQLYLVLHCFCRKNGNLFLMHQSATKCNRKCLNGNLSAISSKTSLLFVNNSKEIEIHIKK